LLSLPLEVRRLAYCSLESTNSHRSDAPNIHHSVGTYSKQLKLVVIIPPLSLSIYLSFTPTLSFSFSLPLSLSLYIYIYIYTYIYVCVCVCVYIYIYIYTHIHVHIHQELANYPNTRPPEWTVAGLAGMGSEGADPRAYYRHVIMKGLGAQWVRDTIDVRGLHEDVDGKALR